MIDEAAGWSYTLQAGNLAIGNIETETMQALKEDETYDTELLPSIFTFREILWQPDVFTNPSLSLSPLRILKAYCAETIVELQDQDNKTGPIYISLVKGLGKCTAKAIKALEKDKPNVKKALGDFRTCSFPIIKFFIYHPKNRYDYQTEAVNRLNYAVKIMLAEFHGKYSDLEDPYWEVSFNEPKTEKKLKKTEQEQ